MSIIHHPLTFQSAQANLADNALTIVRTLTQAGYQAVYAGGCIRDALRGAPVKDIDIATSATPDQVAALFPAQSIGVGKAFGVMLVVIHGISYDVATFRTDGGYQDGRHPQSITFDSAEHDALRRDFTINALFYNPLEACIIDYVGGLEDLRQGCLRTVGDPLTRFREDRLRMLRAIRFATTCQWQIDPATWAAIQAEADHLPCVSIERIRSEFIRTLCAAPTPSHALELLAQSGLLKHFFPELLALRGCPQDPLWHPEGDVWVHTARMLDLAECPRSPQLVWAALLHDIAKPNALQIGTKPDGSPAYRTPGHAHLGAKMAADILRRFKESRETIDAVTTAVAGHMQFIELPKMKAATARHFLGRPTIQLELALHRLDCLSSHAKLDLYTLAQERLAQYAAEPILPPPAIQGRDLIACGLHPGPTFGPLLKKLYTEQLEGATRETLLHTLLTQHATSQNTLFIYAPGAPFPLRQSWEARCQTAPEKTTLMILPGQYWPESPHPQRRILRLVTDCAGRLDPPDLSPFNLIICPAEIPLPAPLPHGAHLLTP